MRAIWELGYSETATGTYSNEETRKEEFGDPNLLNYYDMYAI